MFPIPQEKNSSKHVTSGVILISLGMQTIFAHMLTFRFTSK